VTGVIRADHRAHRDIVTFDQRAAMLRSTTVRCCDETVAIDFGDFARLCVGKAHGGDADLAQSKTRNSALNLSALISALGSPDCNIPRISHGT
jgi:hypothetical protein